MYKWKACLNVYGRQQEHGVNYWDTYASIVDWNTVCLFFIHSIINEWYNKQRDFVLSYPHAPTEVPLYMHFPKGYIIKNGVMKEKHIRKLTKNIYGQKLARRNWNKCLDTSMGEIRFKPRKIDPCLYYWDKMVILIYISDCIMFSPEKSALNQVIKDMCHLPRKYRIEALGDIKDFLGISGAL